MTTRAMGPAAGWDWLKQAVNLGSRNPKAIFGAAVILMLFALLPTVLQLLLGAQSPGVMLGLMGFSLLYSIVVMSPLLAGFVRVIHAAESGQPVRPAGIFDVFRIPGLALQVTGLMLLLVVMGIVLFGAIALAFGAQFMTDMAAVMAAAQSAAPGAAPVMPAMPDGIGALLALLVLAGLLFNGVYAISLGQVALTSRGVGGALADGMVGTFKNALPLLVLLVLVIVLGLLALILVALLVGVLMFVGGLVHPALAIALAAPVYLAAMLMVYVVMVGTMYFMWRDVCGGDGAAIGSGGTAVDADRVTGNQVEL